MIIIKNQNGMLGEFHLIEFNKYGKGVSIKGVSNNINVVLGSYSEERAKEVMAEIENHIEWLVLMKVNQECALIYGAENKFIYTMPKV